MGLFCLLFYGCGQKEQEEAVSVTVPDHIGKGRAFYQQGNYPKAVEMYQKALAIDPDSAEACLQLGIIYDDNLKNEAQAIYYYRRFLALEPESERAERVKDWIEESEKSLRGEAVEEEEELPIMRPSEAGGPRETASILKSPGRLEKIRTIPSPPKERSTTAVPQSALPAQTHYPVKQGDTLVRIAEKFYGDRSAYKQIFEVNRDVLSSPDLLRPGQVLKIPPVKKGNQ